MSSSNNIKNLLNKDLIQSIEKLYKNTEPSNEFEFIFSNRDGKYITQEKYIKLLKFLQMRKKMAK